MLRCIARATDRLVVGQEHKLQRLQSRRRQPHDTRQGAQRDIKLDRCADTQPIHSNCSCAIGVIK
jgi:hypothetical protein